jgi:hypothetical protein
VLSATAALVGSLVGGVSTLAASWFTQRGQLRAQSLVHEAAKREALYAEFIAEASRHFASAWDHHAQSAEALAGLYSAMQRMRLTSSAEVVAAAQQAVRLVLEAYAAPDKTFDELRARFGNEDDPDLLQAFSEACRAELHALRG